jgi:hypothetical protein
MPRLPRKFAKKLERNKGGRIKLRILDMMKYGGNLPVETGKGLTLATGQEGEASEMMLAKVRVVQALLAVVVAFVAFVVVLAVGRLPLLLSQRPWLPVEVVAVLVVLVVAFVVAVLVGGR